MMKNSKYYALTSSEVFIRLLKKINITRYVFVSIMIVTMWERHVQNISFASYIFILVLLFLLLNATIYYHVFSLRNILLKDCDPKKFLNVALEYHNYSNSKITSKIIGFLCACAFFYNGNHQETSKYLSSVFFGKARYKGLNKFILASSYYYEKQDLEKHSELVQILNHKLHHCKYKYFLKKYLGNMKTILSAKQLALDENFEDATQLFLDLHDKTNYRFEKVMLSMYLAEIYLGLGEYHSAKEHLHYVRENGNNLRVVEKADQLLNEPNGFSFA